MKRLVILVLLAALVGGCNSPDDSSDKTAGLQNANQAAQDGSSDGVSTQVRQIGQVKKN